MKYVLLFIYFLLVSFGSFAMDSLKHTRMPTYKYYIYAGSFFPVSETTIRVDGNYLGTYINLENDFNLTGNGISFRTEAIAQLSPRSSISLTYFSIFRHSNFNLKRDMTIDDQTFDEGSPGNAHFNIRFMGASYRYSIFYNKNWSLGLSAGLRVLNVDTGISIQQNSFKKYADSYSIFIPVALIGIHGSAYITPRLLGRYSLEYFGVTIEGIDGKVIDNRLTLEYYILKNFSLGCSFTNIKYWVNDYPIDKRFSGSINYSVTGFALYVGARF